MSRSNKLNYELSFDGSSNFTSKDADGAEFNAEYKSCHVIGSSSLDFRFNILSKYNKHYQTISIRWDMPTNSYRILNNHGDLICCGRYFQLLHPLLEVVKHSVPHEIERDKLFFLGGVLKK